MGMGSEIGAVLSLGIESGPVLNLLFKLTDINVSLTLIAQPPKLIKSGGPFTIPTIN
jgi:hypothetical protein